MRSVFRAGLSLLLAAFLLPAPASALSYQPDFPVRSEAVYLENLDTETVIYEKNADRRMYPASVTKIMTALLVLERVRDPDAETAVYPMMIQNLLYGKDAALGGLIVGERLTVRQLLISALVQSANEAALILADYVGGGSVSRFVAMMNEKAAALGCTGTHFTNPTGLHNDGHYTTARDVAIITREALRLEDFREIVKIRVRDIGPTNKHRELRQFTTNRMLIPGSRYYYGPLVGIKTGSTDEAGRCLVSEADSGGLRYLAVVLGSPVLKSEPYVNFVETRQLHQWAFRDFTDVELLPEGELMAEVPVLYGKGAATVRLRTREAARKVLHNSVEKGSFRFVPEVPDRVEAPVREGDDVGVLHVLLADEEIARVGLVADGSVALSRFRKMIGLTASVFRSSAAKILLVVTAVLLVLYVLLMISVNRRKKRKRRFSGPGRR